MAIVNDPWVLTFSVSTVFKFKFTTFQYTSTSSIKGTSPINFYLPISTEFLYLTKLAMPRHKGQRNRQTKKHTLRWTFFIILDFTEFQRSNKMCYQIPRKILPLQARTLSPPASTLPRGTWMVLISRVHGPYQGYIFHIFRLYYLFVRTICRPFLGCIQTRFRYFTIS